MTQTVRPKPNHDRGFTLGLVLGTLFGAGLGTLLAPQPATHKDSQLAFQAERLRKRLRELRETMPEAELSNN
jgi:hypothetical protein